MFYLQMTPAGAEAGADVLSYANAPSDVSDSLGRFLAAFAVFRCHERDAAPLFLPAACPGRDRALAVLIQADAAHADATVG